ncbi:MAG TPA: SRPBCC family protein [Mycobacterium sp.]|nr:SRPBCC family protein [Mycobacterium sp.]
MSAVTWRSQTTVLATPEHVIDTLTDPAACARWSPVPFSVEGGGSRRLRPGTSRRISGRLLGAPVRFHLHTLEANPRRLRLHARGPIEIRVAYALTPVAEGCALDAHVSIDQPRNPLGRLIGRTTRLMLAAGTLDVALTRIAREAERSAHPGLPGGRS